VLERSFVHLPGVGGITERALWDQGCHTWSELLAGLDRYSVGSASPDEVERHLRKSVKALQDKEHQFFRRCLGMKEAWRAFPDFRSSCVYLDIETDGGRTGSSVTIIGLFDGVDFKCLVKGEDLGNFPDLISRYSMIVTFFGAGYDLPMLQRCFRNVRFDQIHIDLCPTLRRLGIRGGLKRIEKELGILRSPETEGLSGLDAIRLWRRYERLRDDKALETLIAYNREDVVNLERLAEYAYERLWDSTYRPTPAGLFER
jgi:hypothetical protein